MLANRIAMLANRVEALNLLEGPVFARVSGVIREGERKEELFRETVRAVLFEIRFTKQLERYGEALKVVEFVRSSLPWKLIRLRRRSTLEVPRPRNRTGPDY